MKKNNFKQITKKTPFCIIACLYFFLDPFICLSQSANDYFNFALSNDSSQHYSAVLNNCNLAIQLNPAFAKAYYLRGKARYCLKDYRGAIKDENKADQLHLQMERVYLVSAYAKQALKEYKAAIIDFNKAISINPENSITYYHRGFANVQLHNKKEARFYFSKAIQLGMKESGDLLNEFEPD